MAGSITAEVVSQSINILATVQKRQLGLNSVYRTDNDLIGNKAGKQLPVEGSHLIRIVAGHNNFQRIINEEINRVSDLVKSLSLPSDSVPLRVAAVDVNATIADMLRLIRESIPETTDIRLVQDLDENLPAIASDRDRLKQALMNLLKNATEALPDGGTIRVSTRLLKAPEHPVDSDHTGHRIKISVCDNGPGIDEHIKNDLFKPHVTSKTDHNGLGLAIVEETVNRLNGTLVCESTPGEGTCFHIEIPTGNQAVQ